MLPPRVWGREKTRRGPKTALRSANFREGEGEDKEPGRRPRFQQETAIIWVRDAEDSREDKEWDLVTFIKRASVEWWKKRFLLKRELESNWVHTTLSRHIYCFRDNRVDCYTFNILLALGIDKCEIREGKKECQIWKLPILQTILKNPNGLELESFLPIPFYS